MSERVHDDGAAPDSALVATPMHIETASLTFDETSGTFVIHKPAALNFQSTCPELNGHHHRHVMHVKLLPIVPASHRHVVPGRRTTFPSSPLCEAAGNGIF